MSNDPGEAGPTRPLFRQVAIDAAAGTQIGEPLRTHWRGVAAFTFVAFLLVVGLIAFAAITEYSPIQRVPCYVDVRGGLVRLGAPIGGRVHELAVEQGATVHPGTLLASIDSDRLRADGSSEHGLLERGLEEERRAMGREIEDARSEAAASRSMTEHRLAGLRLERESLDTEIALGEKLLASLREQSEQIASVAARGFATRMQASQKQDEVSAQEGRLASLRSAKVRVDLDISTAEGERQVEEARLAAVLESRRRSAGELQRLAVQREADAGQVVRAPVEGTVSTALIARGQSVVAGQALFTIAPSGAPLLVRLLVPARAMATTRPGQAVKLVVRAYPQEKFGELSATIESVSDNPLLPSEVDAMYALTEPAFMATATLPADLVSSNGHELRIKPGMLADALVPVERRSVLEWLFEPLLRGFNESAGRPRPAAATQGTR